jgi:tRNA uridine 5-carboxymethylaminomethyl modification enzyme
MKITDVITKNGELIKGVNFIVTTGTFLRGMIHIGKIKYPAGRHLRNSEQV